MGNNHSAQEQPQNNSPRKEDVERARPRETKQWIDIESSTSNQSRPSLPKPQSAHTFSPVLPNFFRGIPDFTSNMGQAKFCPMQPTVSPPDACTESPQPTPREPPFTAVPATPNETVLECGVESSAWEFHHGEYLAPPITAAPVFTASPPKQQQTPTPGISPCNDPLLRPTAPHSSPPACRSIPCQTKQPQRVPKEAWPKPRSPAKPPLSDQRPAVNEALTTESPMVSTPGPTAPTKLQEPLKTKPTAKVPQSAVPQQNVKTAPPSSGGGSLSTTGSTESSEKSTPPLKVPSSYKLTEKTLLAQIDSRIEYVKLQQSQPEPPTPQRQAIMRKALNGVPYEEAVKGNTPKVNPARREGKAKSNKKAKLSKSAGKQATAPEPGPTAPNAPAVSDTAPPKQSCNKISVSTPHPIQLCSKHSVIAAQTKQSCNQPSLNQVPTKTTQRAADPMAKPRIKSPKAQCPLTNSAATPATHQPPEPVMPIQKEMTSVPCKTTTRVKAFSTVIRVTSSTTTSPTKPVSSSTTTSPTKPVSSSTTSPNKPVSSSTTSPTKPVSSSTTTSPIKPVSSSTTTSTTKPVSSSTTSPTKPVSSSTTSPTKPVSSSMTTSTTKPVSSSTTTSPTKPVSSSTTTSTTKPVSSSTTSPTKPVSSSTTSPTKPVSSSTTTSPTKSVSSSTTTSPTKPVSSSTTSPTKPVSSSTTTSPTKPVSSSTTTSPTKPVSSSTTTSPTKPVSSSTTTSPTKVNRSLVSPRSQHGCSVAARMRLKLVRLNKLKATAEKEESPAARATANKQGEKEPQQWGSAGATGQTLKNSFLVPPSPAALIPPFMPNIGSTHETIYSRMTKKNDSQNCPFPGAQPTQDRPDPVPDTQSPRDSSPLDQSSTEVRFHPPSFGVPNAPLSLGPTQKLAVSPHGPALSPVLAAAPEQLFSSHSTIATTTTTAESLSTETPAMPGTPAALIPPQTQATPATPATPATQAKARKKHQGKASATPKCKTTGKGVKDGKKEKPPRAPTPPSPKRLQRPVGRWHPFTTDQSCLRKARCKHRKTAGLPRNVTQWLNVRQNYLCEPPWVTTATLAASLALRVRLEGGDSRQ